MMLTRRELPMVLPLSKVSAVKPFPDALTQGVPVLRYIDGVLSILLIGADGAPLLGADGALLYGVY